MKAPAGEENKNSAAMESQLAGQFSRLSTSPSLIASRPYHNLCHMSSFDYATPHPIGQSAADHIDLAIDDLSLSSPQLFISQSPRDDVIVTCRVTNHSRVNRCSPPGCHLRCRRGLGFSVGAERHLLPPLLPGLGVPCQLRLRAPVTAPTGWHRIELQLYSPLGGALAGEGAWRCFEVHVAAGTLNGGDATPLSDEDVAMVD